MSGASDKFPSFVSQPSTMESICGAGDDVLDGGRAGDGGDDIIQADLAGTYCAVELGMKPLGTR